MHNRYLVKAESIVRDILENETTKSQVGSLSYLVFGEAPSQQSFLIKFGKKFEAWFQYVVETSESYSLLPDGVTKGVTIEGASKDIDLLFNKVEQEGMPTQIFYYELKSNINLDSEKLPATIKKIQVIEEYLNNTFSGESYQVNVGLLNWGIYERDEASNSKMLGSKFKLFEDEGIKVIHPKELFSLVNVDISKDDYNNMFKHLLLTQLAERF